MEREKESKLIKFCNSPIGALVIVGSIMLFGGITKHYILEKMSDDKDTSYQSLVYDNGSEKGY